MKNKHIEYLKAKAKQYKKTAKNRSTWDHDLNINIYHVYDGTKIKGWWDDVSFIEGAQQVTVWWIHPRQLYHDLCDTVAYDTVSKLFPDRNSTFESTPNYRYLGKNKKRKKVVSHTLKPFSATHNDYFNAWRDERLKVESTGDVKAKCNMSVAQYGYCRGVDICCPIEVVDEASLKQLADFVRSCLKDRALFDKTYGDVVYTKEDWLQENPLE